MRLLAEEQTITRTLLVGECNMRGWEEGQLLRTNNQDVRQVLPGIRMKEGPSLPAGTQPGSWWCFPRKGGQNDLHQAYLAGSLGLWLTAWSLRQEEEEEARAPTGFSLCKAK